MGALRERHEEGVAQLNAIFNWTAEDAAVTRLAQRVSFPAAERERRRQRNRVARAARKRNRR